MSKNVMESVLDPPADRPVSFRYALARSARMKVQNRFDNPSHQIVIDIKRHKKGKVEVPAFRCEFNLIIQHI